MLALLLLGWAAGYGKLSIAVAVCGCRLLGIRSFAWLWPVTLLFLLEADAFCGYLPTHWPEPTLFLFSYYGGSYLDDWAVKLLGTGLRLVGGLLLFRLLARLSPRLRLLALHGLVLGLVALCRPLPPGEPVWGALALFLLLSCCYHFYQLCYLTLENPRMQTGSFLQLFLTPFWETSLVPRPVMQVEPDLEQSHKLTARCLRLALRTAAMLLFADALDALLFGRHFHGLLFPRPFSPLPDLGVTGLTPTLFGVYSRAQIWASLYWSSLYRISNYFGVFAFLECCHLLLNYDVPRRFTFPWSCRSFSEFYNAIMPYYVILVNRVYLYPCFSWLRSCGIGKKAAYEVALFFGVFMAGFFAHLLRDVQLATILGGWTYLRLSLITDIAYYLLLFLALRLAVLPKGWPNWLKFLCLSSLYAVVLLFRRGGLFTTWDERWTFLLHFWSGSA